MYRKTAQGMPFTLIIVAVLALVVLFLLGGMFTGKISFFSAAINDCSSSQGVCKNACGPGEGRIGHASCEDPGEVCCTRDVTG